WANEAGSFALRFTAGSVRLEGGPALRGIGEVPWDAAGSSRGAPRRPGRTHRRDTEPEAPGKGAAYLAKPVRRRKESIGDFRGKSTGNPNRDPQAHRGPGGLPYRARPAPASVTVPRREFGAR